MAHVRESENGVWTLAKPDTTGGGFLSPICIRLPQFFNAIENRCSLSSPRLLIAGLLIFSPLVEGGTTHFPMLLIRAAMLCFFTACVLGLMQRGNISIRNDRLLSLVFLFVGYAALTLVWSPYKNPGVQWLVTLSMYVVLFDTVLHAIRSSADARALICLLAGMGIVEGGIGLAQYFLLGEARARGTFFNPNFFGTYEVCIAGLVAGVLCFSSSQELRRWEQGILWTALPVAVASFIVAQSRGAALAMGTVIAFVGIARFRYRVVAILACCLLAGALIPNPLKQRFIDVSVQDPYAYSRVDIWKSSLQRVMDHPLGFGLGMYKYTSFQYRFPVPRDIARYGKRAESAHNEYLQMAVELGVAGVVVFLFGIMVWGMALHRVLKSEVQSLDRGILVGLCAVTLGILAHGFVDSVFHETALVILLIACGGMAWSFVDFSSSEGSAHWNLRLPQNRWQVALVVTFAIALGALVIQPAAGWYSHERGEKVLGAGKAGEALAWFRLAAAIDPGTAAYHDTIARFATQQYQVTGDMQWLTEAVEEERLAMFLNPLDGRFPHRLGLLYASLAGRSKSEEERRQRLLEAAESQELAVRLDPYSPQAYLELATIRLLQGQASDAHRLIDQALLYEPNFLPARLVRGEQLLKNGKHAEAKTEYQRIQGVLQAYEGRKLTVEERQYLDVDPYPFAWALAMAEGR